MSGKSHPTRRTGAIKPWLWLASTIAAAWLVFAAFEPIFVWKLGWKELPPLDSAALVDTTHADWPELAQHNEAWLRAAYSDLHAPALSAAIGIDGRIAWSGAIGYSDLDHRQAVALDTSFRIGSSSKAITSVAVGTLLDSNSVDLDAPLRHYLPDLAEPLADITTRQAMSHTAGVRDYGLCWCLPVWEYYNRRNFSGAQRETLRDFESDALLFKPGNGFAYTSHGYNITGAIVEAASDLPFITYVHNAVLDPLDMRHTGADLADSSVPGRAGFYAIEQDRYKPVYPVDNSNKWPSGGFLSTPADMLQLGFAMLQPKLFSAATRDLLITPQALDDGSANPQGYALGWRYSDKKKLFNQSLSTSIYSHHGVALGSASYFAVYPEFRLVVSLMINHNVTSLDELAEHADRLVEHAITVQRARVVSTVCDREEHASSKAVGAHCQSSLALRAEWQQDSSVLRANAMSQ